MSEEQKNEISLRVKQQFQKSKEYKEGKCTFEDYMNTVSVTNMTQIMVLSEMVFECIEKLNGIEIHLRQFDSPEDDDIR